MYSIKKQPAKTNGGAVTLNPVSQGGHGPARGWPFLLPKVSSFPVGVEYIRANHQRQRAATAADRIDLDQRGKHLTICSSCVISGIDRGLPRLNLTCACCSKQRKYFRYLPPPRRRWVAKSSATRSGFNRPGLNILCGTPSWIAHSPSRRRSQSRFSLARLVLRPWVGGRPVEAPPWKRHFPPAPVPGSLQGLPVWREVAVQRGSDASTARALRSE